MAISTYDGLVAGLASGQSCLISKASIANTVAAQYHSLRRATGVPTQPAIPTATVATCITNIASLNYNMNITTAQTCYIAKLAIADSIANSFFICDRLLESGGYVANATGLTAISAANLPNDRGLDLVTYADTHWFMETYTDLGGTGTNLTFTYDSPTSSTQTSIVAVAVTTRASRLMEIIPNVGHPIVRLKSFRFTATTGTAGSWGITAVKEHGMFPTNTANIGALYDFAQVGMHDIPDTADLMAYVLTSTTSTGVVAGMLRIIKG